MCRADAGAVIDLTAGGANPEPPRGKSESVGAEVLTAGLEYGKESLESSSGWVSKLNSRCSAAGEGEG